MNDKLPDSDTLKEYYALWLITKALTILKATEGQGALTTEGKEILYHLGETMDLMLGLSALFPQEIQGELNGIANEESLDKMVLYANRFVEFLTPQMLMLAKHRLHEDMEQGSEHIKDKIHELRKTILLDILKSFDPVTIRRVQKELDQNSET